MIRDASDADLEAIVAIYNDSIPGRMATSDLEPVSVDSRRHWFAEHTPDRRPLWVSEGGGGVGGIEGWISFESFYGRPAYAPTAEVSVYVASAAQGTGVGKRLLTQAVERAPQLGLRTLLGFIWAHNDVSLGLFEGLGFARWGRLPQVAVLDDREVDLVIVGRRVGTH